MATETNLTKENRVVEVKIIRGEQEGVQEEHLYQLINMNPEGALMLSVLSSRYIWALIAADPAGLPLQGWGHSNHWQSYSKWGNEVSRDSQFV